MATRDAKKQKKTTETSKTRRPTTKTSELRRLVFTHCGRNEISRWTRSQLERYLICRQLINIDDNTFRFVGPTGPQLSEDNDDDEVGTTKWFEVDADADADARFKFKPDDRTFTFHRSPSPAVSSSILTDRAHDVLVVEHLESTSSFVFDQISTNGLTDLSTELQNSRDVLADVSHENTSITTHLAQPHLTDRNFRVVTTNHLGFTRRGDDVIAEAVGTATETEEFVLDDRLMKYVRHDETVHLFFEGRLKNRAPNGFRVKLPFESRAQACVFQMVVLDEETNEFSGMGRAYAIEAWLYVECFLFAGANQDQEQDQTSSSFPVLRVNVQGNYMTRYSAPVELPLTPQGVVVPKWITPTKSSHVRFTHLNRNMMTKLNGEHDNAHVHTDLGFHKGSVRWVRSGSSSRFDAFVRVTFRQRTDVALSSFTAHIELPCNDTSLYGTESESDGVVYHGYGETTLPEFGRIMQRKPEIAIIENQADTGSGSGSGSLQLRLRVPVDPALRFHEVVVQGQVSFFEGESNRFRRNRSLQRPVVRAKTDQTGGSIFVRSVGLLDSAAAAAAAAATSDHKQQLLDQYRIVVGAKNRRDRYQTYTFVRNDEGLVLSIRPELLNRTLRLYDTSLHNQTDQAGRRFLYPRYEPRILHITSTNYRQTYDGPYDLLPDFTQYI